ncbi:PREDICTED: uncharacterized protein LOC101308933 isoform X3 [Fragaria vesca subsp. vesca]|uniref:uncharacterized protein LOC101308933 isoform X3 n=1 Tax=Fragaria vesca subsp. vesca TaxID=101020 RepID=UPI0002C3612C|nr:PREDICTED: uncharacterized protein LOC101308933 isoform X3 [Fragaria vesca subsp. vesca]
MAWSKRCRFYNFPLSLKTRRLEVSSSSSALKSARSAAQLIPHMAPRVRARKRGHLDRALKAMAALSFPEKLVRDTVDELLEVYGGDHGWGFIEDASYSVLVDALLEKQQDGTEKPIASPQDHARSEHGPETSAVVPTCTPLKVVQSQTTQPLNSTPLTKIPAASALEAEAMAASSAMELAKKFRFQSVIFESDSQNLVDAINGSKTTPHWSLIPTINRIRHDSCFFRTFSWRWTTRQANSAADHVAVLSLRKMCSDILSRMVFLVLRQHHDLGNRIGVDCTDSYHMRCRIVFVCSSSRN